MPPQRIVTIGVYGFSAEEFFQTLAGAEIDLFCDLRARRGVRGREYAYANARRLEARLADLAIEYTHVPALAPTKEIRSLQHVADTNLGVPRRRREELHPAFVRGYEALLDGTEAGTALERIRQQASAPALFCVERLPTACHRSLAAARLSSGLVPVEDIVP